MRRITAEELQRIPGMHFLTQVGRLRSTETPQGSRHVVDAVVRVPSDSPLMSGRSEWSHVVFLEAANNLSHWIEHQVPAVDGVLFKVPTAFPRGMGMPPIVPDEDIAVRGETYFQLTNGRWRGEVTVEFYRADGSRAETVNFPLIARM